ncbi:hypothetical protein [Streptomyces sp. MMG1121]|nr:hypothetical protein [Streptomyces sp. MMG1121]
MIANAEKVRAGQGGVNGSGGVDRAEAVGADEEQADAGEGEGEG